MKIAFCIFNYFPFGGLQRDFFRTLQACIKRGHSVDIYTEQWQGEYPDKANIFIVPVSRRTNHARASSFIHKVSKKLDQNHYDRVIGFNKMAHLDWCFVGDVCLKDKIGHRFWYYVLPRYFCYLRQERSVFGGASKTKIMLLNQKQREGYERQYPSVKERIFLLPPGIAKNRLSDREMLQKREAIRQSAELGAVSSQPVLLFVAAKFFNKGLDRAILALKYAFEQHNPLLCVIGNDSEKKQFVHLAEKNNVLNSVRFLGAKQNVLEYMFAADLLIHPARTEAAGMVLLEALTARLPILTTEACGYAVHVKNANAGVVLKEPFSQESLNRELLMLLYQGERRKEYSEQARRYSEQEDFYSLTEKAVGLIERRHS